MDKRTRMSIDPIEKDFPKHYLFITTTIFTVTALIAVALSVFFPEHKVPILVVGLVCAHLLSVTTPINADWYWKKTQEETKQK